VTKGRLGTLIWNCYKACGHDQTVAALDRLKEPERVQRTRFRSYRHLAAATGQGSAEGRRG